MPRRQATQKEFRGAPSAEYKKQRPGHRPGLLIYLQQSMLDIVVIHVLADVARLSFERLYSLVAHRFCMLDRILSLLDYAVGLLLHAVDIVLSAFGGGLH
jgi:hypothetical protein